MQNLSASVRQRLLNLSYEHREDFQRLLDRYAIERLLYRLSVSEWADQFLLKGAMLFLVWSDRTHRPTRDLDLLGFGRPDIEVVQDIFRQLIKAEVEADGISFDADSVRGRAIREDALYAGIRLRITGYLAGARIDMQVDIGFGDAVFPAPTRVVFPVLLDFPAPELRAYSVETVIAEKFEALVVLGIQNSRMKDFFDLYALAGSFPIEGALLAQAIEATFTCRQTPVPVNVPTGLSDEFAFDGRKGKRVECIPAEEQT